MKRIIIGAVAIAMAACTTFASGVVAEGPIVEREIPIESFDAVSVSGIGRVRWTEAATPKLVVRTHESVFEYLDCRTVGGKLRLGFKNGVSVSGLRTLEYTLSSPSFGALDMSGSSDFEAFSPLESKIIDIDVSGSGSVKAELVASRTTINISGSGSMKLSGRTDEMELDLSGSGSIEGKSLEARRVSISVSGSGKVETTATETLDARTSGSGSIRYWGNPRISVKTSGSSNIRSGN